MSDVKFSWINEGEARLSDGMISIRAQGHTDFFCGLDGKAVTNAAIYYREVQGDCVIRAKVAMDPPFSSYDGAGLIICSDDRHWVKGCLEASDFGTIAAISVVTNDFSDDANGPNVNVNSIWLQITRKGDDFAVHYSLDGKQYDLIRICKLPLPASVKAGLVAQAPLGEGGFRHFEEIVIREVIVADLRSGR